MDDRDRGSEAAGRAILNCNIVGWLGIVGAAVAALKSPPEWVAAGLLLFAAAVAFGLAANAVLRS
jgi:hypothetical protein